MSTNKTFHLDEVYEDTEKKSNISSSLGDPPSYHEDVGQEEEAKKKKEEDVWAIVMDQDDNYVKFSDMSGSERAKHILKVTMKILGVLLFLFLFICSLSLLSSSFQIIAGKTGGELFTNEYLSNPITGLIVGILVTVLVQSSSTSTSIIITMTGAGILHVHEAIPIIMGTNIGTSVTNTIVSLTQSVNRQEFRKAFAGATVHDMFNFLTVLIFLPIEVLSGYLETITYSIVSHSKLSQGSDVQLFDTLTDPVTDHVIQVNKSVITLLAQNIEVESDASMIKIWCKQNSSVVFYPGNDTRCNNNGTCDPCLPCNQTVLVGDEMCDVHDFIFANTGMTDAAVGIILLIMSLISLCVCLILMVKLLSSMLKGSVARVIKKVLNTNFPYPFGWVTGYLAIIVGAILTFLVQSSSVFTSTMTPLVGIGVISLKRMYPLTLGSNIGTTATGIIAAFAGDDPNGLISALQLSLCHFFFNISGIIVWYPIPIMRRVPIRAAKTLGNTTAKYRWFAVIYLIFCFFLIPGLLLGLSFAGIWVMGGFLILVAVIILFVIVVNVLQSKKPSWLPKSLRTWDFLPLPLHSLQPYDKFFTKFLLCCKSCKDPRVDALDSSTESDPESENDTMEKTSFQGIPNEAFHEIEVSTAL